MGTIGLKIKMMVVYLVLRIMSGNIEKINEKVKELVGWAKSKETNTVLLGGIGTIEVRLVKEGKAWWIAIGWDSSVFLKDRLTNGFYAFNKKTLERLKEQFTVIVGTEQQSDFDHLCEYVKGFNYFCQIPEFGLFDRISGTEKELTLTPHEDFGNYINISGKTSRKVYGQYELDLVFKINMKYARGYIGELVCDQINPFVITRTVTKEGFNKQVGTWVADYIKDCLER